MNKLYGCWRQPVCVALEIKISYLNISFSKNQKNRQIQHQTDLEFVFVLTPQLSKAKMIPLVGEMEVLASSLCLTRSSIAKVN